MRHAAHFAWNFAMVPGEMPKRLPQVLAAELRSKERIAAIVDTGLSFARDAPSVNRVPAAMQAACRPFQEVLEQVEFALTVRFMGSGRKEIVRAEAEVASVLGQNSDFRWVRLCGGEGEKLGRTEALGPLGFLMRAGERMFAEWFRNRTEAENAGESLLFFLELEKRLAPVLGRMDGSAESGEVPNAISQLMEGEEPVSLRTGLLVLLWRIEIGVDTRNLSSLEDVPVRKITEPLGRLRSWFRIRPRIALHRPE
jgi:hypothetical protein